MLGLEFEPRNLPPTHTLHLPNSGVVQDSLLRGKTGVTHTLFVKLATKVMMREPVKSAEFLVK